MSNITQILFRRGNDASRQTTLLAAGEPGLTTDSKRLFVGDGVTPGGNIAGNINIGAYTQVVGGTNYNNSGLDTAAFRGLSAAQIGDLVYETSTNIVYALSATPNGSPKASQLYAIARNVTLNPTEFNYSTNSQINLANQGVSGIHINPTAADNTTVSIINNQITLTTGTSSTGITNNNFQYAPANSVKGNFTGSLSSVTDLTFSTGLNNYQFLGTANGTGLGVIGLSAGQNVTFTTVPTVQSNGQTVSAVVIDSTPNIEAGDGIVYNKNPNSGSYAISTSNSVEFIPATNLHYSSTVSAISINAGDGTTINALNMPYTSGAPVSSMPVISFETVAKTGNPPEITLYWTTTGLGGSYVTVFASNSAQSTDFRINQAGYYNKPIRGPLFPSYWHDYKWTTSRTTSNWVGGGFVGGLNFTIPSTWLSPIYVPASLVTTITYDTHTILADWPATINCMYLSGGTRLWLGGNFHNFGQTSGLNQGAVRYGIAVVDLLSGTSINSLGSIGGIITLSASTGTAGLSVLNSAFGYGLTQGTPGHSVRQIAPFTNNYGSNLLCVGGNWLPRNQQPSTSFAIFDTTNNYNLSGYTFRTYNGAPATVTSLASAGDFMYVAGNFTQCGRSTDTYPITGCVGLTRIKLNSISHTGNSIDTLPIGSIDQDFTRNIANQLYTPGTTSPQTVYRYPINCLDIIPNISGGYVLYAGGNHWAKTSIQTSENYLYHYLTTHWIGNTALGGADGNLTRFNAIFNGPVNVVTHNTNSTDYNVYIGGNFTTFTSQRQQNQTLYTPCNYAIALDTTGFQVGLTQNINSTLSGNQLFTTGAGGGSTYTSPDAPQVIQSWFPAFNKEVTGIDCHEVNNPNAPVGSLSAIYFTGKFTAVGKTKVPYAAALPMPAQGIVTPINGQNLIGLTPSQWYPHPNAAFKNVGGKGTNILRIPYTSALSGVLLAGNANFNNVHGNVRPGWARITGLNETPYSPQSVTWSIASAVLGQGNFLGVDDTYVTSLSDLAVNQFTVNKVQFGAKSFAPLYEVHRGDLCRFVIYRPGASPNITPYVWTSFSNAEIPNDTFAYNVQLLGIKVDWDTGTADGNYPYQGSSTLYAPACAAIGPQSLQ